MGGVGRFGGVAITGRGVGIRCRWDGEEAVRLVWLLPIQASPDSSHANESVNGPRFEVSNT